MNAGLELEGQEKAHEELTRREGESEGLYFRGDRFYTIDGSYFFSTREAIEVGPFGSRSDAEEGLQRFIDSIKAGHNRFQAKSTAVSGVWSISHFQ